MVSLSRAQLLIEQNKFDLAEKELTQYLASNPNDGAAYSLLALTYLGLKKVKNALDAAQKGIGLAPYSAFAFYVLSKCHIRQGDNSKAEEAIRRAIQIDPQDSDYLTVLAAIQHDSQQHEQALITIDEALNADPENSSAKHVKSSILRKLGRFSEAHKLASRSLMENPENDSAFAAKGWALLDAGKPKEALEHFRAAVVIDPTSQYNKSGLVTALKAQNKLFNLFYRYYNWVGRLSSGARWALVIGLFIFARIAIKMQESDSPSAPIFGTLLAIYFAFVFLTWTINPIFNIFLRFNKYGKHALDKGETMGADVMLGIIASALVMYVLHLSIDTFPITGTLGALFMTLPVSATFGKWDTPTFGRNVVFCIIMAVLWAVIVIAPFAGLAGLANSLWTVFLLAVVGYTWVTQMRK